MSLDRLFEFVWLPTFERSARKLLGEDDLRSIEGMICEDLETGALLRRTGGFRKLRYALAGAGKSGGARVIYFVDERCGRVYMIAAYPKGKKEALSDAEENALRKLATQIKREDC